MQLFVLTGVSSSAVCNSISAALYSTNSNLGTYPNHDLLVRTSFGDMWHSLANAHTYLRFFIRRIYFSTRISLFMLDSPAEHRRKQSLGAFDTPLSWQ